MFDAVKVKNECVQWIRDWFEENGKHCNAVVGISGGKDSSIVAALCAEALGKNRVIGVLMPNGTQHDIKDSIELVRHLGIKSVMVNIENAVKEVMTGITCGIYDLTWQGYDESLISEQAEINLPPRIRMATLYAVSQSNNGRVANTCNLSEDWIGYSTRYGDSVGDFSPLSNLTVTEVKAIGYTLGLPKHLIDKTPSDGLCGKTDEDHFGFTYAVLDKYIREGVCDDEEIREKIDRMHKRNLFKLQPMAAFEYDNGGKNTAYHKSRMSGAVADYQKMYNVIKNWNEASPPTRFVNGEIYNEEGHHIYDMGWVIGDMVFHGWSDKAAENERHHYEEVRKAHKALKVALQNALGIKQTETEY